MITIGGQLDGLMPPLAACHIVIHYCHVLCCTGLAKYIFFFFFFYVGNFQLSVGKLQLPDPPTSSTHDAAEHTHRCGY